MNQHGPVGLAWDRDASRLKQNNTVVISDKKGGGGEKICKQFSAWRNKLLQESLHFPLVHILLHKDLQRNAPYRAGECWDS
jgi:hypothetical protein